MAKNKGGVGFDGDPADLQAAFDYFLKTGDGRPLATAIWTNYGGSDPTDFDSNLWRRAVRARNGDQVSARDLFDEALYAVYFEVAEGGWINRDIRDIYSYAPDAIRRQIGRLASKAGPFDRDPSLDDEASRSEIDRRMDVDSPEPVMKDEMRAQLLATYIECRNRLDATDQVVSDMDRWGAPDAAALPFSLQTLEKFLETPEGRTGAGNWKLTTDAARFGGVLQLGHLSARALGSQVSTVKARIKLSISRCIRSKFDALGLEANDFFDEDWKRWLGGAAEGDD